MLETILVPLDGSAGAEVALPFATEIAARARANLILATAASPIRATWNPSTMPI